MVCIEIGGGGGGGGGGGKSGGGGGGGGGRIYILLDKWNVQERLTFCLRFEKNCFY